MRSKLSLLPILLFTLALAACGSQAEGLTSSQTSAQPAPKCSSSISVPSTTSSTSTSPQAVTTQHMHMGPHMKMTSYRPATAIDIARIEAMAQNARVCFAKYKDYHLALQDGYQIFAPNVPQDIYHFASVPNFQEAQTSFDLAHPSALLYKKINSSDYQLVGVMYSAPAEFTQDQLNERVPLSVAPWHLHVNICLPAGDTGDALFNDGSPFGVNGTITTAAQCSRVGGTFLPQMFGWMVHIYLYGGSFSE